MDCGWHSGLLFVITSTGHAAEWDDTHGSKTECENLRIGARLLTGSAPAAPPTENLGLGMPKTVFTVDKGCTGSSGTCSWVKLSAATTAPQHSCGEETSLSAEKKATSLAL